MADEDLRFAPSQTDLVLRAARTALHFPTADQDTEPMVDYHLVRGDTDDPLTAQCIGSDGDPVDLSDARITLTVKTLDGTIAFETSYVDPADDMEGDGWIQYEWKKSETKSFRPGHYQVGVTVRWSADRIQTFPNDGTKAVMRVSD